MIDRADHRREVSKRLREFSVVAILGARQVGKTTLPQELLAHHGRGVRFDLEEPADLARLEDPGSALRNLRGLVVLDEIQRRPDLFPVLRAMLSHYHGQTWNGSELARSLGVSGIAAISSAIPRSAPPGRGSFSAR